MKKLVPLIVTLGGPQSVHEQRSAYLEELNNALANGWDIVKLHPMTSLSGSGPAAFGVLVEIFKEGK